MINPDSGDVAQFNLAHLAERLRIARESAGLSQPEFADRIGYSRRQVSAWEAGATAPPIAVLIALRRLGNVDPEWILTGPGLIPMVDVPPKEREREPRITRAIRTMAQGFGLLLPEDAIADLVNLVLREPIEAEKDAMARMRETLRAISSRRA